MDTNNKLAKSKVKKMKEKKVGFGIADVFIILLVLAIVGGVVWFFVGSELFDNSASEEIRYVVRLTKIRDELVSEGKNLQVGDGVYDGAYGEYIGKIESVVVKPHTEQLLNKETGELVDAQMQGYSDVYLTITATVKWKDHSYFSGDTEIKVGERIDIRLVEFCGQGFFTSVSKVDGGEQ